MRNSLCITFLFVLSVSAFFSQEPEKLKKYQSAVSKQVYSKGDTLVIGEPGKNVFSAKKKYIGIFIKDKKNVCGYRELDTVITGSQCVIKNILSFQEHCTFEFKNSVVFELQGPGNQLLYMPIDKALQAKELVVFTNPNRTAGVEPLDERTIFLLNLDQFKGTSADNALKYCKIIDPAKGKAFELNPSQFEKEKGEWIRKLDAARKEIRLKDTFLITLPAYLSKYAFDKSEFTVVDNPAVFGSKALKYSGENKVLFDNFKSFTTLRAPKANADFFQNVNTPDYNGNRKAYAQVKVICTSITKDPPPAGAAEGMSVLHLTILEIYMTDSENLVYNYIGMKRGK